ncbi:TIM-barrel domain-containing protein [Catenulispora subtropica]|uniref:CBM6 domain-containing protein n=1 Tax=Catenulispora subtropica TaxID=450798 RepID=A0ABP5ETK1_9ACTN
MQRIRSLAVLASAALALALTALHAPAPVHAATSGAVVDGNARFTVLSPTLIRMEYAADKVFEDRPTFNAVNRSMPTPPYTTSVEGGYRVIRTSLLTFRYLENSGPFTAANVSVDLTAGTQAVTAHPQFPGGGICAYAAGCEAESQILSGGASIATDHTGYTGSAFVAGLTAAGAKVAWNATGVPAAGSYAVQFRYSNSTGGDGQNTTRTMTVTAGGVSRQVSLPITADWNTWAVSSTTMTLPAGSSGVSVSCGSADSCNINIDSVAVTAVGAPYPTPVAPPNTNLGGYRRSLDGQGAAVPMADGLLTRDGWYLMDDTGTAILNADDTITQRPDHGGQPYQDGYFFGYGHDYRQGLKDLHDLTGPAVLLPEWAFGVWNSRYNAYSASDYENTLLPAFRSHQTPIDVQVIDTDFKAPDSWNGWEWNNTLFPDPQGFMNWTKQQGLQVSLNIHSSIVETDAKYAQAQATAGNSLQVGGCSASSTCRVFDWSDPRQLQAYMDLHQSFEDQGVREWWLDWCCDDSHVSAAGVTPDTWINSRYAARGDAKGLRGFAFARAGSGLQNYSGSPTYPTGPWAEHRYTAHFTGDTSSNWNMLAFEPQFTVDEGNVGMPYVTHDIGGFNGTPSDDLYARWVQFGAFQPILRLHSNHSPRLPWEFGAAAEASAEKFLRLREALVPYTYTLARQAADTGLPITRGLYLDYPEYNEAYTSKNEYLYGDDVLVAPVSTPGTGTVTTSVWFPPGTWTDYFTGTSYTGPATVDIATTLNTMPVFLKSGGIMPSRTDYVDNTVQNPLDQVTLDVATGADGAFSLYEDAGEGNGYKSGQSATTATSYTDATHSLTINPRQGTFPGAVATRTWTAKFRGVANAPSAVTVNGVGVTGYTYDATTRTLTVPTPAASATATTTIAYTPGTAPPTGPIVGAGSARCVDIPNANPADSTQLQLYDCNGTVAQAWTLPGDGTVRAMGKCMDVAGANTADGTAVQIYTCNGTAAQKWTYDSSTSELRAFGKCLDASGGGTANGTKLILYTCHGGTNQQWRMPG